ncbi:hypothetical protein MJD09_02810 [bacterium]|nr:hypothetical protein [bacterium]
MTKRQRKPSYSIMLALLITGCSQTEQQTLPSDIRHKIDPVVVSSQMYKVLLENQHVRVVEYQINPGEKDNWHTHPPKVSYVISGGTLKIIQEENESFVVEEEAGTASWLGTVGKHYVENVGKTSVRILLVEVKNVAAEVEDLKR